MMQETTAALGATVSSCFEPFSCKNGHFAKTGSGQTWEWLRKRAYFAGDGILVAKDHAELGDHANAVLQEGCSAANATIVMLQGLAAKAKALRKRLVYQCHTEAPVEVSQIHTHTHTKRSL